MQIFALKRQSPKRFRKIHQCCQEQLIRNKVKLIKNYKNPQCSQLYFIPK